MRLQDHAEIRQIEIIGKRLRPRQLFSGSFLNIMNFKIIQHGFDQPVRKGATDRPGTGAADGMRMMQRRNRNRFFAHVAAIGTTEAKLFVLPAGILSGFVFAAGKEGDHPAISLSDGTLAGQRRIPAAATGAAFWRQNSFFRHPGFSAAPRTQDQNFALRHPGIRF